MAVAVGKKYLFQFRVNFPPTIPLDVTDRVNLCFIVN